MADAFASAEQEAGKPAVVVADQFVPVPGDRYQELKEILAGAATEEIRFDQAAHLISELVAGARPPGRVELGTLREVAAIVAAAIPEVMLHNSGTLVEEWTAVNTMVLELESEKTELKRELQVTKAKAEALEAKQSILSAQVHKGVDIAVVQKIKQQARRHDDRKGQYISLVLEADGTLTRVTL